jgi:hypothetical protein
MQIVFHLGAHFTDEGRLVQTLLDNSQALAQYGCIVPEPERYRGPIRDLLVSMRGAPASSEVQETLLDSLTDQDEVKRLILSSDNFMGFPARMIGSDGFHALAPARLRALANLFPTAQVEFHLGLINPATLIPQLLAYNRGTSYDALMFGMQPTELRWAPVVQKMLAALNGQRMVIWCNEDTPLIWPEVLRSVAGLEPEAELEGDFAVLETIMAPEGMTRMKAYITTHPPRTPAQRRKIVTAFLDKFGLADKIEVEVPLPGWDDALVADITAAYDADVAEIAALPGVEFIAP